MKEVEFRDATLYDLIHPSFKQTIEELASFNVREQILTDIFYERQHCGVRTIVGVIGEEVVCTGSIFVERKFIHDGGKVAHVEDMAVHKEHKANGLGRQTVNYLIGIANICGCYKIILNCSPKVVGFYEKLGFKKYEYEMRMDLKGR